MVLDLLDVDHLLMYELMNELVASHLLRGMLLLMSHENQVLQNKIKIYQNKYSSFLPGFADPAPVFSTTGVSLPTTEDMIDRLILSRNIKSFNTHTV